MLRELRRVFTGDDLTLFMGREPSIRHLASYRATRHLWLLWAMFLHPHLCRTSFDIATWGRFVEEPATEPQPPDVLNEADLT